MNRAKSMDDFLGNVRPAKEADVNKLVIDHEDVVAFCKILRRMKKKPDYFIELEKKVLGTPKINDNPNTDNADVSVRNEKRVARSTGGIEPTRR
jgi:hypothetical protein